MIVHGPCSPTVRGTRLLICCGRWMDDPDTEPGLVTSDPGVVTCKGAAYRFHAFAETFTGSTFVGAVDYGSHPLCHAYVASDGTIVQYIEGEHLQLESGTLDIGLLRDIGQHYGERWRPWKRHLHHRGVPQWARRLAGWQPLTNDFEMFREEWER